MIAGAAVQRRRADQPCNARLIDRQHGRRGLDVVDRRERRLQFPGARGLEHRAAVDHQPEGGRGVGQRQLAGQPVDHRIFRSRLLEKLQPRRRVVEERSDPDSRPDRTADRACHEQFSSLDANPIPLSPVTQAADRLDVGDRGDAGQGLAAKAERFDASKIIERLELARRVPLKCQRQVGPAHSPAVIDHLDQLPAGTLDEDLDSACSGVDRILDQLLDDRRRPIDNLARRDAVGHGRREDGNCLTWLEAGLRASHVPPARRRAFPAPRAVRAVPGRVASARRPPDDRAAGSTARWPRVARVVAAPRDR